jgi:hypothetical protein
MRCARPRPCSRKCASGLELAREAWAEAREEGQGHVSAGLAALRAAAGRQAKELDPDEIKQRLARIAGRELARSMITRRGRGAGTYAAGLPMCWAKPGPKTRSGKRPARRNASRSWTKSASGSANSTGISDGNCSPFGVTAEANREDQRSVHSSLGERQRCEKRGPNPPPVFSLTEGSAP